jgi:hypothetical protein
LSIIRTSMTGKARVHHMTNKNRHSIGIKRF